ncbi:MAG: hypothetical protein IJ225_08610 [Solobacterium sp.]|nr:hypothetical protein [Solobacterium sp.]
MAGSTTGTSKKTTTSTAKKKTTTSTKKKTSTTKKKTSTASIKLTAAEKKLVQNYRKCNALEKEVISILVEKASGELDLTALLGKIAG